MIIRFFKKSFFPQLITLIVLTILWWIPSVFVDSKVLAFPIFQPSSLSQKWLLQTSAVFIFIITAFFVNYLSIYSRLSNRNSYLSAFFFILLGSALTEFTHLTPVLLATFFLVLFYQKVFQIQKSNKVILTAFDAGLWLGISGLFYPPVLLFFLMGWFALIIYQSDQWQAYITFLTGIFLPWFFIFTGLFWLNNTGELTQWITRFFHLRSQWYPFHNSLDFSLFVLFFLTLLVSVLRITGNLSSLNINQRQNATVVLWGLLFSVLLVALTNTTLQALLFVNIPAALLMGSFFSEIKKLRLANIWVFLLIILIFINHYLFFFYAS